jgi:hypothetical protein
VIPAVLAGLGVWCLVPAPTTARQRAVFGGRDDRQRQRSSPLCSHRSR